MLEIHSTKFCNLKVDIWLEVGPSIYVDACYGMFGCYIIAKSFSIIIIIIGSFSIRNAEKGYKLLTNIWAVWGLSKENEFLDDT